VSKRNFLIKNTASSKYNINFKEIEEKINTQILYENISILKEFVFLRGFNDILLSSV